jgi:hypothetical protein
MAEALSLAASVVGVLQLSCQVITVICKYSGGVRSAKSDMEAIEKELNSLNGVLKELEAFLEQTEEPTRLSAARGCESSLDDCNKAMETRYSPKNWKRT